MSNPRPVGVTVMAVLAIVFGLFGACGAVMSAPILFLDPASGTKELAYRPYLEMPGLLLFTKANAVLGIFAAAALITSGVGLLLVRPWARTLALVWAAYSVLSSVVT